MSSRLRSDGGKHLKAKSPAFVDSGGCTFAGLSEDERNFMVKTMSKGDSSKFWEATDSDDIKAQYSKLNEDYEGLKAKYDRLDSKVKGLDSDLRKTRAELNIANQNLDTNRRKNSDLQNDLEVKKQRILELVNERDRYKSQLENLESNKREAYDEGVKVRIEHLIGEVSKLNDAKARLENDLSKANDMVESLEKEKRDIEECRARLQLEIDRRDGESQSGSIVEGGRMIVVRTDVRTLEFRTLEDGNYDMRLSGDRTYITVRPDPNGKVHCWGGAVVIPRLGTFLDFTGRVEYDAEVSGDMIRVRLQGPCRWYSEVGASRQSGFLDSCESP